MQTALPDISVRVFDGFGPFLEGRGVALTALLQSLEIEAEVLDDPHETLPLAKVSALFELAAQETREPCLGLQWAEAFALGATGAFGYLVLNAATLREAMQAVARYLTLVVHPARVSFVEEPSHGVLSWHLASLTSTSTTQYVSFSTAATVLRLKTVAGRAWQPMAVELTHRELPCSEMLHRIYGNTITFNAPINAVYASKESLDLKAAQGDPRLFELVLELGERLLAERAAPHDFVTHCQQAIIQNLSSGNVTLEIIAEKLGMPPRTLQSKLANSDVTFDALLQDTRKDLAVGYLRESDLTLTDIAMLLGFSELSVFSRATQRWFGMSPSAYRQQLRQKSLPA